MKKTLLSVAVLPLVLGGFAMSANANGINILNNVKFNGEIRPRWEHAERNTAKPGNAFTARTSLGVNAGLFDVSGLSTYIQGTAVTNFGYTDYNSGHNGNAQYGKVVDPQQARITQAYIDYKAGKTLVRAGRQVINLDNQRFIGSVNWRQMFQTLDAVTVVNTSVPNLTLIGSYVYGINGVGYQNAANGTSSVVLHADYKVAKALKVTAYSYMLASLNNTYGAALTGKLGYSGMKFNYRLEFARQTDPTLFDNSNHNTGTDVAASYYNIAVGTNISGVLAGLDYESLGRGERSGQDGFSTPLATLHKFNGLADVFLKRTNGKNTLNYNGLTDANAHLGYKAKGLGKFVVTYHKFNAQRGTANLGSEVDAIYTNKIPGVKNLSGLIGGAFYHGNGITTSAYQHNQTVTWLMLNYKFASN